MTVRVSGLFDDIDAAEGAVRGLGSIMVYERRISRLDSRKLGASPSMLSGTVPGASAVLFGNVGQSYGQGVFLPTSMLHPHETTQSKHQEVQLEVWVAPLDAQETAERFINAHGHQVRLY